MVVVYGWHAFMPAAPMSTLENSRKGRFALPAKPIQINRRATAERARLLTLPNDGISDVCAAYRYHAMHVTVEKHA
jgi:hypothetical protein